jgi:ESCRT-II complex subunit VPS36
MRSCEMCTTPLPRLTSTQTQPQTEAPPTQTLTSTKSAPSSRPVSPDLGDNDYNSGNDGAGENPTKHMIKLSFRKGGDKAFYAVLKRSLLGKAWEVGLQLSFDRKLYIVLMFVFVVCIVR